MRKLVALADRTAVLFLGVAAGVAIGFAFGRNGEQAPARPAVAKPARIAAAGSPAPPAAAADTVGFECALPFQQHLLDTVAAGRPVTVGVFGDSFGDGVWSALYRLLPKQDRFRVLKYSQQSTGFTRYSSLNLEEHAQQQLDADGPVDVAVISFGANDTQGVYSGGHAAALMSPEWQRVIGARVERFVALLRARGAMVYWVGLPKMRKASFDDDIAAMNDFYTARMKALRVPFIDIKPLTVDGDGAFALYLPDPVSHERRLLRANDGVHMSMNGYVVITRGLAERIRTYVGAARTMAGVGGAGPAPVAKPAPEVRKPEPAKEQEKRAEPARREEERARPKREEERPKRRRERDGTDKERPTPAKRDEPDRPPRQREGGDKDRPATSPKHEDEGRDRTPKPSAETKPRSDEAKSGETRSATPHAGEHKPSGETRPVERKDKPSDDRPRSESKSGAGETKPHADSAKPKSGERRKEAGETKAKPGDGRPRSDETPKPRKPRDDNPPPGEGNSQ